MTHKLENNTKEVLALLWRLWESHQASPAGDPAKGLGIPRESDFEGQQDLITRLPQVWGKQRLCYWSAQIDWDTSENKIGSRYNYMWKVGLNWNYSKQGVMNSLVIVTVEQVHRGNMHVLMKSNKSLPTVHRIKVHGIYFNNCFARIWIIPIRDGQTLIIIQ